MGSSRGGDVSLSHGTRMIGGGLEVDLRTKPLDPFVAGFDNFLPGPAGTHFKDEEHFFR